MRAVRFFAPHPLFGRGSKPLPLSYQQRSPYYWYWAYLRRNEEYLRCCERGGKGRCASLYADFGDVRGDDFKAWWTEGNRGAAIFGERALLPTLRELTDPSQYPKDWERDLVMIVAVPLTSDKKYLRERFAALLKRRHEGKRGKRATASATSTAKYKLAGHYTISNLWKCLEVFALYSHYKTLGTKRTLAQIGEELRLVRGAMPSKGDPSYEAYLKRQVMAATVSRYLKQARRRIRNAGRGVFP